MRKFILLMITTMLACIQANAHDFSAVNDDGVTLYFKMVGTEAVLTYRGNTYDAYDEYSGDIKIPSYVMNGTWMYFIYTIGENAFRGCKNLTSISIPASIKSIENSAFRDCTGLVSANITNGVNSVTTGGFIFQGCTALKSIVLPASISNTGGSLFRYCTGLETAFMYGSKIGDSNFEGCTALRSVTMGRHTATFGSGVFAGCNKLEEFIVPEDNANFSVEDGVLFNKNKTILYSCTNLKTDSYVIPGSVTEIKSRAFQVCENLTSITIPETISSDLRYYHFEGCVNLQEFILSGDNQTYSTIDGVLCNKDKTTLLIYPAGKGSSYTIPASVTEVSDYAFYECMNLKSVNTANVVTLGEGSFDYCKNLTDVSLGDALTDIGWGAFYYCSGLKSITVPDNVVSLGNAAFEGCSALTNAVIGKKVETMGFFVFYDCINLKEIHSRNAEPPVVDELAPFWNVNVSACKLYVPIGSSDKYKAAEVWKDFPNIIEEYDTPINSVQSITLTIYPNPATEQINIQGLQPGETIHLYNINGQLLLSREAKNGKETIIVAHLPAGIYLLKTAGKAVKWVKQ